MKPPPPILPARGYVTAIAKPVATAASTALPPCLQHVGADARRNFLLRRHHAVFGDNGMDTVGGKRRGAVTADLRGWRALQHAATSEIAANIPRREIAWEYHRNPPRFKALR